MQHGFLVVDKEPGMTSHDVVAIGRRALGTRKVGHAGTLDPMATGILVLGFNNGTRLLQYITDGDKTYQATVVLGAATITDDSGCSVTVSEIITEPDPLISDIVVLNHESCPGESDGQVEVIAVGGVTITQIEWSDGQSNLIATGLSADTYWVTLTDNNGCIGSGTGVLRVNALPVVTVNSEIICSGDAAATFKLKDIFLSTPSYK